MADSREVARVALAGIRLFNGLAALVAPAQVAARLGVDTNANPAMLYVLRMFGIRTVLIGLDLLGKKGKQRAEAARQGVLIHASDTVAAFVASRRAGFPTPIGNVVVVISLVNTLLAALAAR
ncbi:MAG: hypothetical protein M3336_13560 [Chloroflexota bacterium]|nr:hypothetical protein [Chloroflexota bacterium]